MEWFEGISLVVAGFLVGVINTLAGGATVISLTVLMVLGLPVDMANGTHRVAALFQTFTSSSTFMRQKVLKPREGWKTALPAAIGSVFGALLAVEIDKILFMRIAGVVMLLILVLILFKPRRWLEGKQGMPEARNPVTRFILFFLIGFYGGFIYIGIGYFLIFALVLYMGYDLLRANAVKVMIVFLYVAASLLVYILNDLIAWKYAAALALGQVLGAWLSARFASRLDTRYIRWFMVVFLLLSSGYMLGLYDVKELVRILMN